MGVPIIDPSEENLEDNTMTLCFPSASFQKVIY